MEKNPQVELLEQNLNTLRAAKSMAMRVIADEARKPPERDERGNPKPAKLTGSYYEAVRELKDLMAREQQLVRALDRMREDLQFVPARMFLDREGHLRIEGGDQAEQLIETKKELPNGSE